MSAYYQLAEIRGQKARRRFSLASRALALCSSELSPPQEVAKGNGLRRVALRPLQLLRTPPTEGGSRQLRLKILPIG